MYKNHRPKWIVLHRHNCRFLTTLDIREARAILPGAHTVCFESWFAFPLFLRNLAELGLDAACRLKKTSRVFSTLQGKPVTLIPLNAGALPFYPSTLLLFQWFEVRTLMLAVAVRLRVDQRFLGTLFYACCDEIPDITGTEALRLVCEPFSQILQEVFRIPVTHVQQSIAEFLSHVPSWLRKKLMIVTWMS